MPYVPCSYRREEYLKHRTMFESGALDEAIEELTEFNEDAIDLSFELAYMRFRLARAEQLLRERDGGAHDQTCRARQQGRQCTCGHDEVMSFLAEIKE